MCREARQFRIGPTKLTANGAAVTDESFDLIQSIDLMGFKEASITLTVLGTSGTPAFVLTPRSAPENDSAFFNDMTSFTSTSAAGTEAKYYTEFSRYLNFEYDLAQDTSVTIVIDVVAKC